MSVFRYSGLFMPPGGLKPGPPEPPETATMTFRTQPTDKNVNEWFDPWVTVEVSDGRQGDTVSLSPYSGTCSVPMAEAVTNATGYALFPGLSSSTPGQGCRLRARNLTRPRIPDVLSAPFNVIAPTAVEFQLMSWNISRSGDGSTVTSEPIDTTGADLIVATINTDRYPGTFREWIGEVEVFDTWQSIWTTPTTILYYARPLQTGPQHVFQFVDDDSWAAMGISAFKGWNGQAPTVYDRTAADNAPPTATPPSGPLAAGTGNLSLTFAGVWRVLLTESPVGYQYIGQPYHDMSYGQGLAIKLKSDVTENPVWAGQWTLVSVPLMTGGWVIFNHA